MSRNVAIIIIILASMAVILASFGVKIFFPSLVGKQHSQMSPAPVVNKEVKKSGVQLPIDPNLQAVARAQLTYIIIGRTLQVKRHPQDLDLFVGIKDLGKTQFTVNKETAVVFKNNNKEIPAKAIDLKINQDLIIISIYDLKTSSWKTNKVIIEVKGSPTASPSASKQ